MKNQNPKNVIMNIAEEIKPLMKYEKGEDFNRWQEEAREKLVELLGLSLIPKCEHLLEVKGVTKHETYTDTYFTFQSEPGYFVPCHILRPENSSGKLIPLICLQGHTTGMHISIGEPKFPGDETDISSGDRDYARLGVEKGYCAITVEQRYMGECGGTAEGPGCITRPEDGINALPCLLFGRTAIGERVHDVMKIIDIITEENYSVFSDIDTENIILTGNSGGGTTTFYASCVDTRVKYSVPSCCFCTYKASIVDISHCGCNYIPSVGRYFDMGDLAGLIAPRGLVISVGKNDKIFPIEGVKEAYCVAEEMYKVCGAYNKLRLVIGEEGHRYYASKNFEALKEFRVGNIIRT